MLSMAEVLLFAIFKWNFVCYNIICIGISSAAYREPPLAIGLADGLDFGPDGAYTSGDAELDRVVLETLSKIVTEEMTQEEKLKAVFLYCAKEFKYLRRDYFDKGTTGWWHEPAYIILTTGKGNCYNYNAAFCALGRALGYSFDVISGTVGKNRAPHGWCFIVEGEDTIVYDPELYMRHPERGSDFFFAMSPVVTRGWSYKTE